MRTLGLPNEPPADVLDLAGTFGARLLILTDPPPDHRWLAGLEAGADGSACFTPIDLGPAIDATGDDPLAETTVYRIGCPEGST